MLPSTHSGPVYGQCIPDKSAARPQSYGAGNGMGLAHASPCPWSRACRTGLEGTTTDPWPWSKGFFRGRRGGGPAPRDCQHWHSRISLFRWVFFGSSKICKEVLVSFASPTESRGSQWTSKVGQWYQKIPMPALLISRLACKASAAILGVTNCFILSVIDSRGKQKRGFCFVLTNPLQGTTLRCQRLLCIYNADDTHNSEVSWPQVQTQHERWYIKLTLSQLGKKKRKAKKNTSDLYQACLPSINTNIKLAGFVIPVLEIVWYSTRAKQSKAERKVFPSINLEEQEEEICWTWKGTFKFTEVTAHSGLQYPPPLSSCLILPPTCRLWHLCLLLPHFFHCTLVHVQV